MDVEITTNKKNNNRKMQLLGGVAGAVLLVALWSWSQPSGAERVSADDIWVGQAKQGNLAIEVEGYGKLKSKVQRLLTTPADATVEEILLKPGAKVTADSIVVKLVNPGIEQQVKDAKRELVKRQTSYKQMELDQQREILSQQADLERIIAELEVAQLKVEAEESLVKEGIVSELTFKGSKLDHRQLVRRIAIEKKRLQQLREVHAKILAIQQDEIEQQKELVSVITEQFEKLTVRAGIDGVLQNLKVEIGQSVKLGEQVAMVGSTDKLFAMLNISQSQMQQVAVDQIVEIDTRAGKVEGKVTRISPVITKGTVEVEVDITGELPNNARPELTVDGVISSGMLSDATYLKKPANAVPGANAMLFRLDPDSDIAQRVNVTYGQESGQFIQILNGAKNGDAFILSDMSRWQGMSTVTITQ